MKMAAKQMSLEMGLETKMLELVMLEERKGIQRMEVVIQGKYLPAKVSKLPTFQEKKDDLDAYWVQFEQYAYAEGRRREDWATNLSALLTGTALHNYH